MTDVVREIIAMLNILKENSGSLKLKSKKDYTIIMDCKKASFDFIIDQAIAHIIRSEE